MSALEWKEEENLSLLIYQFLFNPRDLQIVPIPEQEWRMALPGSQSLDLLLVNKSLIFPSAVNVDLNSCGCLGDGLFFFFLVSDNSSAPSHNPTDFISPLLLSTSWKFAGSNG